MTRILVIDDHDVVRKGLITSLKANGFERIDSAVSTKDARSKIATFNPQGIIVDINLSQFIKFTHQERDHKPK